MVDNLLIVMVVGGIVGAALGAWKNRLAFGIVCGLLIGPIGWVILLLMPNNHPKCPACKGNVIKGATKCKNCGSDLPTAA